MALSDLWQIVNLPGYEQLRDKPFMPAIPKRLIGVTDIFAAIREGDILLHHPYESFDPGRAVFAAGRRRRKGPGDQSDPLSHVGKELADRARAARGGRKRETSRGRHRAQGAFRRREQHRVGQAPGARGRARRVRLCQPEGARKIAARGARRRRRLRRYMHFGTGNYNEKTSRLYTDISLFTCRSGSRRRRSLSCSTR